MQGVGASTRARPAHFNKVRPCGKGLNDAEIIVRPTVIVGRKATARLGCQGPSRIDLPCRLNRDGLGLGEDEAKIVYIPDCPDKPRGGRIDPDQSRRSLGIAVRVGDGSEAHDQGVGAGIRSRAVHFNKVRPRGKWCTDTEILARPTVVVGRNAIARLGCKGPRRIGVPCRLNRNGPGLGEDEAKIVCIASCPDKPWGGRGDPDQSRCFPGIAVRVGGGSEAHVQGVGASTLVNPVTPAHFNKVRPCGKG